MLEALPEMVDFFMSMIRQYWSLITGCSVLAAFLQSLNRSMASGYPMNQGGIRFIFPGKGA